MAANKLTSILLASTDPERLGDWYAQTLTPETDSAEGSYRILGFGEFYVLIDTRADIGAANPEPGRMILNFEVSDARAIGAKFNELGTKWLSEIEDRDGSLFGTVIDPDGNYVQIIQLSEEHRAAMSDKN